MYYSLKVNRKKVAETFHPVRNEQFEYIDEMKNRFFYVGGPAISVDSKKIELILFKHNLANPKNLLPGRMKKN